MMAFRITDLRAHLDTFTVWGVLICAFVSAITIGPMVLSGSAPGDLGDARFNIFVLEHVYQFVTGRAEHFASPSIFYPFAGTLFFSDTHIGSAMFYVLFRAFGFSEYNAFVAWFTIGYLTTYIAAYYAFSAVQMKPLPAALAAACFAFALPSVAQFGHAQLVYRCGVPLAILYLFRSLRASSFTDLLAAVLWLCVQILISVYLGVFLGLLMFSFAIAFFAVSRTWPTIWVRNVGHDFKRRALSPRQSDVLVGFIFILAALATIALLLEYGQVARIDALRRSWADISTMLPRPSSYLIMDGLSYWRWLTPFVGGVQMRHEHQMFMGLGVLGLFAVGVFRLFNQRSTTEYCLLGRLMLISLVIVSLLTLSYISSGVYHLIDQTTGFSAIAGVTRIILVQMFPIAYIAGIGVTTLFYETERRVVACVGIFLTSLAALELRVVNKQVFSIAEAQQRVGILVSEAEARARGIDRPILVLATPQAAPDRPWETQLDAMLAAQRLGWPTVNGYSGNLPPSWNSPATCADMGADLRTGLHFASEHGLHPPAIAPNQLVLMGLGPCGSKELLLSPTLAFGHDYEFAKGGDGNYLTGGGFARPEGEGRWTEGRDAYLYFSLTQPASAAITVRVEAIPFSAARNREQTVGIALNDINCGDLHFAIGGETSQTTCSAGSVHEGENAMHFRIANPARPSDYNLGPDERNLGVAIKNLTVFVESPQ